jgi:hypothetical protein
MNSIINSKVDDLARQVMQGEMLESFMRLPLIVKLAGIAVFAEKANDQVVRGFCIEALNHIQ